MKQTAWKRAMSLLMAVVMCLGMIPAMAIPIAAKQDEVFADDFSLYPVGADTFWQSLYYAEFSKSLHNYSGKPVGNGDLSDIGVHSDWAADALKWAVEEGLLEGIPFIHVTETATRAQTAQILMKYLTK